MPELDDITFERRLRGVLKEHLDALPLDLTVETLERRREARGVARRFGRGRGMTLLAAAALLLVGGALAAGSGLFRRPSVVPPMPAPSLGVVATASPDATFPSSTPSVRPSLGPPPSDPIGPLAWTQASVEEDWPAPVREEPEGGATVLQIRHRDVKEDAAKNEPDFFEFDQYRDPTGDAGSDVHPWADIRSLEFCGDACLSIRFESDGYFGRGGQPPDVDPSKLWIAYGVVADTDRDGSGDWRHGIDNALVPDQCGGSHRAWSTDLHTGRTKWSDASCPGLPMDDWIRRQDRGIDGLPERFYAWASVIVNGRVVATDYAPDVGWLERSPDARPLPKPGGPFMLQDPFPVHLSMTVPDGWTDHGAAELTRETYRVGSAFPRSGETRLTFEVVDNPENPCPDDRTPLGPSFDDLVSYLAAMPNIVTSETRYVTLDGYRAVYLESRPADNLIDLECVPTSPLSLEDAGNYESAWIVDVDGVRLVIGVISGSAPAETIRSEVRQIVESIQIIGVSPSYSPPPSPSPTPRPTPTPTPAPLLPPAAGPVPPNARSWTITVDNRSSKPATLFVAEGAFRLVGSATPNVVAAGISMKVTFLFPAKGGPDVGWISVNPRRGDGADVGSVGADNMGMPGKILIREEGDSGWLGP